MKLVTTIVGLLAEEEEEVVSLKRIITVLTMAAFTATMVLVPGVAVAQDDNISQLCEQAEDFGVRHGGCVSAFNESENLTALLAYLCQDPAFQDYIETFYAGPYRDITNPTECVDVARVAFGV